MPKKREYELIKCKHFQWIVFQRGNVWYADGRSNKPSSGRHSLGTRDYEQALKILHELDGQVAADLGLAPQPAAIQEEPQLLTLEEGRKLYETHIKRPKTCGGLRKSTQKRYKTVFDKFIPFAKMQGILTWNKLSNATLDAYATHLEDKGYAPKTLRSELTTLVQTHKWLLREKHLVGVDRLQLTIEKHPGERAYCYTEEEVAAMIAHCHANPQLSWLHVVITALATTGMRIAEVAALCWRDVDLDNGFLTVADETGLPSRAGRVNREVKGKKSRIIPIHEDLAKVLMELNARDKKDAYVFHGPRDGMLKPDTVRQILVREVITPLASRFAAADGEKGFQDGRLHSFRHYFVSYCANRNTPELTTMRWLGHQDSEMTKHYYHLNDSESRRQMNRLDPLGTAGQRRAGVQGAAITSKEEPRQESDPKIAT